LPYSTERFSVVATLGELKDNGVARTNDKIPIHSEIAEIATGVGPRRS